MKRETFLEQFNQVTDAPNAMAKMRELVLQLALQGRLVKPTGDDEPVEKWLQRIWADQTGNRFELANADKPQPFNLPAHWRWVVLAEVAQFSIGKTPPRGDSSYWYPEDHSWVSIADMKHYGTITETKEKVSSLAAQDVFRQRFAESGSILMSFKLTIGKVARAGIRCFHNEAIISLKPPEAELGDFLFRFLPVFAALQTSNNAIKGSTLNKGLLTLLPIALPPLAEQKRIVEKVNELMALCDRLEAQQWERETRRAELARASLARFADAPSQANLDFLFHPSYTIPPADLRKSILTLAVQGLLVPHDAEFVDWETKKLKDLTTKIGSGSTPSGGKESYQESGVPLIRSMNVHFGGFVRGGLVFLNEEQAEKLKNVTVKSGDVLLNITGASIGRVATAPKDMEGARVNQHVCIIRPTSDVVPAFLELFLASPVIQDLIDDVQVGATREALTKAMIEELEIPVPSIAEQRRIVNKVHQLMALVDRLEAQLAASRATAPRLLQALVDELTARELIQ